MKQKTSGVTLIELLVVVAILAIIGVFYSPLSSPLLLRNHFETTQDKLVSSLHKAQAYSSSGKSNSLWGVCMYTNEIRFFSGTCSLPTYYETYSVPQSVDIVNLDEIKFNQRGEPDVPATITITTKNDTKQIEVAPSGSITIN